MRVALLLDRFPMASETFVLTEIAGLLESGADVTVLCRRRPPEHEPEHVEVRALDLPGRTLYLDRDLEPDALDPVPSVPLAPGTFDVLHAHFGPNAQRYLFARAQADAPLVVTFHGHDFSADPRRHAQDMYTLLFETADIVTYNSLHARRALERLGCPADKLRLLPMPVDVRSLAFRPRVPDASGAVRFLTVGRLVEKKGHEIALRAVAAVRRHLPPFSYDVVGDGPLAGSLAKLVRSLGLADVVRLRGAGDSAYVRRALDDAHLFLLPSRTASDGDEEGTPVSLMEAQACGLPVVATTHGGVPEVVLDGRTGLLVPEGDVDALADALVRLAGNPDGWTWMGAQGRAYVEATFDVRVCTAQLVAVYEAAVGAYAVIDAREATVG